MAEHLLLLRTNGQQNASVTSVIRLASQMCSRTIRVWWNSSSLQDICSPSFPHVGSAWRAGRDNNKSRYDYSYNQGSHASWKLLECPGFFSLKFQDLESPGFFVSKREGTLCNSWYCDCDVYAVSVPQHWVMRTLTTLWDTPTEPRRSKWRWLFMVLLQYLTAIHFYTRFASNIRFQCLMKSPAIFSSFS